MPVKACSEDGKSGWKWGDTGKCYTYTAGDDSASGKAKQKAYLQGAAVTGGKMTENNQSFVEGRKGGFWQHR